MPSVEERTGFVEKTYINQLYINDFESGYCLDS